MINLLLFIFLVGAVLLTAISIWVNADWYFPKARVSNKYKSKIVAPDYYKESKSVDTRIIQVMIANLKRKF